MERVLSVLLIPIAIALAFRLFRRFAPNPVKPDQTRDLSKVEQKRFGRWQAASVIPFFAFTAALGLGWYYVLCTIGEGWIFYRNPDARFLLAPSSAYWALPALFLGIVTSAIPTTFLFKALLGTQYGRFEEFTNFQAGFQGRKIFTFLSVLVGVGAVFFLVAGVRGYTAFDDNGMKVNRVFSWQPDSYSYDSILAIQARPGYAGRRGKRIRRPHYVVSFRGGKSWSTLGGLRDPDPDEETEIMRFVAERSGVPITGSLTGNPGEPMKRLKN